LVGVTGADSLTGASSVTGATSTSTDAMVSGERCFALYRWFLQNWRMVMSPSSLPSSRQMSVLRVWSQGDKDDMDECEGIRRLVPLRPLRCLLRFQDRDNSENRGESGIRVVIDKFVRCAGRILCNPLFCHYSR
jgi:hypothetical protein